MSHTRIQQKDTYTHTRSGIRSHPTSRSIKPRAKRFSTDGSYNGALKWVHEVSNFLATRARELSEVKSTSIADALHTRGEQFTCLRYGASAWTKSCRLRASMGLNQAWRTVSAKFESGASDDTRRTDASKDTGHRQAYAPDRSGFSEQKRSNGDNWGGKRGPGAEQSTFEEPSRFRASGGHKSHGQNRSSRITPQPGGNFQASGGVSSLKLSRHHVDLLRKFQDDLIAEGFVTRRRRSSHRGDSHRKTDRPIDQSGGPSGDVKPGTPGEHRTEASSTAKNKRYAPRHEGVHSDADSLEEPLLQTSPVQPNTRLRRDAEGPDRGNQNSRASRNRHGKA